MTKDNLKYLEWMTMEIERTEKEIEEYCNSLKSDTKHKIINSNTVELIRAAQAKLKILELSKQMYQVHHKLI
ncbi:MAG TPA: hypothetical protein DEG71_05130 [Clostridiales bacterium]|nr:hypothetical protein [Clostridiales bacterium]